MYGAPLTQPGSMLFATNEEIYQERDWPNFFPIEVTGSEIIGVTDSQSSQKYFGVTFDWKLSFKPHLKITDQKKMTINSRLARMLPNVNGAKQCQRVSSVLLHVAPV